MDREMPRLTVTVPGDLVDEVRQRAGTRLTPVGPSASLVDPSGHVRPQFENGGLVLLVRPGPAGTVVPVEKRDKHACAGH